MDLKVQKTELRKKGSKKSKKAKKASKKAKKASKKKHVPKSFSSQREIPVPPKKIKKNKLHAHDNNKIKLEKPPKVIISDVKKENKSKKVSIKVNGKEHKKKSIKKSKKTTNKVTKSNNVLKGKHLKHPITIVINNNNKENNCCSNSCN